ncbi:hypothetical protein JCM15093_1245 [Bacteroides graminisolvens DSM 19988 = JCM 15093]|jgi:predicted RNA-binding protein with EMAP domain|uniref:Four helix bundle protein n=1 Tax=Bacteroides graminisolvens DSM 19988 = JCM 15093 TaxID=1121097 RepID=A0A069CZS7_9BACE|nr:hypothetical protein JCM15093_1245 [Bacteroides graminisolvens DSM 19988 = JCM 15093]
MFAKNKVKRAIQVTNQLKNILATVEYFYNNPEVLSTRNLRIIRKICKLLMGIINMLNNQKDDNL